MAGAESAWIALSKLQAISIHAGNLQSNEFRCAIVVITKHQRSVNNKSQFYLISAIHGIYIRPKNRGLNLI